MRKTDRPRQVAEKRRDGRCRAGLMPAWFRRLEDHFDVAPDIAGGMIAEYFNDVTSELLGQGEHEDLLAAAIRKRQTRQAQPEARAR